MRLSLAALLTVSALGATVVTPARGQTPDAGPLNVLCSAGVDWCNHLAKLYTKQTGNAVTLATKSTNEVLAQIAAEKANPKTDLWFGGTGDPHLQAAEIGLLADRKSFV